MSRIVAKHTPKMSPAMHAPPSEPPAENKGQQMMKKMAVEMHQALGTKEVNDLCISSMESMNFCLVLPASSQPCFQSIVDRYHKTYLVFFLIEEPGHTV